MKKQLTIFLIIVFVFGLIPINSTQAISQSQIDAEVQIVCTDGVGNWFSGSGTIIDPKGIILTNRHVAEDAYQDICFIGFVRSISQEPDFGTQGNYNLAEVKYKTTTSDMDAAILYLDNPNNVSYSYVDIWGSNSDTLKFGDKVEVIGFPSIGGSTITYTSGDFSGFGSSSDGTLNYIKTTAPLEHGNSGGASYNSSGQFIGIPTMVVSGSLNSLSYVLSVNSIKSWLSGILGNSYQREIIEQKPIIENSTVNIQDDITPPKIENAPRDAFWYKAFNEEGGLIDGEFAGENNPLYDLYASNDYRKIQITMGKDRFQWSMDSMDQESGLYSVYYSFSNKLSELSSKAESEYIIKYLPHPNYKNFPIDEWLAELTPIITLPNTKDQYYISIRFKDNAGNISERYILTYLYGKEEEIVVDNELANRLRGKLLLQVEDRGRIWYVNPDDAQKHEVTFANALPLFQKFALGITNKDLNNIPLNNENKASSIGNRLKGKLLLQVEDKGRIWYVDFDGKKWEVTWNNLLDLFRKLSLGITNMDLNKIQTGNL